MNHRVTIYTIVLVLSCLAPLGLYGQATTASATTVKTFSTPKEAADALIDAAEKFDVPALEAIFGPVGDDIIHTGEPARDREMAKQFVDLARKKMDVSVDPK